jgi:hypothetical protein
MSAAAKDSKETEELVQFLKNVKLFAELTSDSLKSSAAV